MHHGDNHGILSEAEFVDATKRFKIGELEVEWRITFNAAVDGTAAVLGPDGQASLGDDFADVDEASCHQKGDCKSFSAAVLAAGSAASSVISQAVQAGTARGSAGVFPLTVWLLARADYIADTETELGIFLVVHCLHRPIRVTVLPLDRDPDSPCLARFKWAVPQEQ